MINTQATDNRTVTQMIIFFLDGLLLTGLALSSWFEELNKYDGCVRKECSSIPIDITVSDRIGDFIDGTRRDCENSSALFDDDFGII